MLTTSGRTPKAKQGKPSADLHSDRLNGEPNFNDRWQCLSGVRQRNCWWRQSVSARPVLKGVLIPGKVLGTQPGTCKDFVNNEILEMEVVCSSLTLISIYKTYGIMTQNSSISAYEHVMRKSELVLVMTYISFLLYIFWTAANSRELLSEFSIQSENLFTFVQK